MSRWHAIAKVVMIILGETIRLKFGTFNQQRRGGEETEDIKKTGKTYYKISIR